MDNRIAPNDPQLSHPTLLTFQLVISSRLRELSWEDVIEGSFESFGI